MSRAERAARRRVARELARQDGATHHEVCKSCHGDLEVNAPHGWTILHDPDCPVLAGDAAARIAADMQALYRVLGIERMAVVLPGRRPR